MVLCSLFDNWSDIECFGCRLRLPMTEVVSGSSFIETIFRDVLKELECSIIIDRSFRDVGPGIRLEGYKKLWTSDAVGKNSKEREKCAEVIRFFEVL